MERIPMMFPLTPLFSSGMFNYNNVGKTMIKTTPQITMNRWYLVSTIPKWMVYDIVLINHIMLAVGCSF